VRVCLFACVYVRRVRVCVCMYVQLPVLESKVILPFPALLSPSPELLLCLSSLSSRVCVLCVILSCLNLTPPRIYPLTPLVFPDMSHTHLCLCVSVLSPLHLCSAQPCLPIWRQSSIQTPCPAPVAADSPACPQFRSTWIDGLEVPPDVLAVTSCVPTHWWLLPRLATSLTILAPCSCPPPSTLQSRLRIADLQDPLLALRNLSSRSVNKPPHI
jgi:hypothetical protein